MKKMIIALILIIPLLFLFTVFSAAQAGGLHVSISVNGIEIKNAPENDTLYIDLAKYDKDFVVQAAVTPQNAANKDYRFSVEKIDGTQFADVSVSQDGVISANSLGSARIVVTSFDGGYTDSMDVVVNSSKTVDVIPGLYAATDTDKKDNLLDGNGHAEIETGTYGYSAVLLPASGDAVDVEVTKGAAYVDEGSKTVLLPYAGECELTFSADGGIGGKIVRKVSLSVNGVKNTSGILVNGEDNAVLLADKTERIVTCYLSLPDQNATIAGKDIAYVSDYEIQRVEGADNAYKLTMTVADDAPDKLSLQLVCGANAQSFTVSLNEFAFTVTTSLPVKTGNTVGVLAQSEIKLYAVSAVKAQGITYSWTLKGGDGAQLEVEEGGSVCILKSGNAGSVYSVECTAYRNGAAIDVDSYVLEVKSINNASSIVFNDAKAQGLGNSVAIGEYRFSGTSAVKYNYEFALNPVDIAGGQVGIEDLALSVSDGKIASVSVVGSKAVLSINSTGEVTVTASWLGNANYGVNVSAAYTFTAVKGGVEAENSDGVFYVCENGYPLVLKANVDLGTDSDGNVYPLEKRLQMLGKTESTYNTQFLKNSGMDTKISYVVEFKNNVYGNGYTLNAEHFAKAEDATGKPLIFKGSLPLVGVYADQNQVMKVSAQDNVSFLIRTDNITVSNVNLQGCSDERLISDGSLTLSQLNNAGTVLDINADCRILNCRIKNGKTCVRVYGGNSNGGNFLVQSLSGNPLSDSDRIIVEINGCIISQAREFLVKTGANRALKSQGKDGSEPALTDANGNAYDPWKDNSGDKYFYDKYVMTDLTVKNCVLEKSGLFALGMESNFSGPVLNESILGDYGFDFTKAWGVGGTMFASVIRLEGDVRFYDWKILDNIDSSGLVEVFAGGSFDSFKLDIKKMMESVVSNAQANGDTSYDTLFTTGEDGLVYINGAIVKYGGGKNYASIDMSGLNKNLCDFTDYKINIAVLKTSDDPTLQKQGEYLPLAAGTQDFVFSVYGSDSVNSLAKQLSDYAQGIAYESVKPVR